MYILFSVSSDSSVPQLGRLHSTFNLIQSTLRPVAFAHFARLLCAATRFVLFHFFITSRLAGFGEQEHSIRITCLPCSSEHAHIRYHAFYRYVTLISMRVTRLIQLAHRPAPFSPSLSLSLSPSLTPFTPPACKRCTDVPQKQYSFRSYNKSIFSAKRFDENHSTCQCEKEDRKS